MSETTKILPNLKSHFINFYNWFNASKIIKIIFFILFATLNFLLLKDYVIWRDVARPILYINDSNSLIDLYNIARYDGTPMLYHFIMWLISKVTYITPAIAKGFHYVNHLIILYVVIYVLRLPNIFKLLLLLQIPNIVYVLYIRQYSLAVLFILLFAHFYSSKGKDNIWVYIWLLLLTQTVLHGCVIAIVFLIFIMIERYLQERKLFHKNYLIVLFGVLFCILQCLPPSDLIEGLTAWNPIFRIESLTFLPNFLADVFLNNIVIIIGFSSIIFVTFFQSFQSKKNLTYVVMICLALLFLSFYLFGVLKYSVNRHHWLLTYSIVAFLIILASPFQEKIKEFSWKPIALIGLLGFSLLNFYLLNDQYNKMLFSNGKNVAEYLDSNYSDKTVLASVEYFMEPVFVYRQKSHLYYSLGREKYVKYTKLNHESVDYTQFKDSKVVIKHSELIFDLYDVPSEILKSEPIVLLSAYSYEKDFGENLDTIVFNDSYRLKHIRDFNGALFENYRLFQVIMSDT